MEKFELECIECGAHGVDAILDGDSIYLSCPHCGNKEFISYA